MIAVDRGDGMIVAGFPIAAQNPFHHFFPIGGILEGQPDIVVTIGFGCGHHGHGVVESSLRGLDLNAFDAFKEADRFPFDTVHVLNLTCL